MAERYREYVVRKYIRARNAAEAIDLEKSFPVCEVNEAASTPAPQNPQQTSCVGFRVDSEY